jgi:alkaline phosphatase D
VEPDGPRKTLLGRRQLRWLARGLRRSRATWKVVASDVPISVPTGTFAGTLGRDGWANGGSPTGFERELGELLGLLDRYDVRNLVFVTADIHWATSIRYETDADGDGDLLRFHEFASGPLSALTLTPVPLDPTFGPVSLYAEGGILNFGYARIAREPDGRMHFLADVRGEDGLVRPVSSIDLAPE